MIRRLMIGLTICGFLTTSAYAFPDAPPMQQGSMPCNIQQMNPPPMMHGPEMPGQMGIQLSTEQQEQIKGLQSSVENESKQLLEKAQQAREAVMKMQQQVTFNEDEFRKAAKKVADIDVELMVLRAKTTYKIRSLLTEEQKNQIINAELRFLFKPEPPKTERMMPGKRPGLQGPPPAPQH